MVEFGVLRNTLIENVIVAESLEIAEKVTGQNCVLLPTIGVGIGWYYIDGVFTPPLQEDNTETITPTE
jgi:hypothetical protein